MNKVGREIQSIIREEVARYPGASVMFGHGGKHNYAVITAGFGKRHKTPLSKSPSSPAWIALKLADVRRILRQWGLKTKEEQEMKENNVVQINTETDATKTMNGARVYPVESPEQERFSALHATYADALEANGRAREKDKERELAELFGKPQKDADAARTLEEIENKRLSVASIVQATITLSNLGVPDSIITDALDVTTDDLTLDTWLSVVRSVAQEEKAETLVWSGWRDLEQVRPVETQDLSEGKEENDPPPAWKKTPKKRCIAPQKVKSWIRRNVRSGKVRPIDAARQFGINSSTVTGILNR